MDERDYQALERVEALRLRWAEHGYLMLLPSLLFERLRQRLTPVERMTLRGEWVSHGRMAALMVALDLQGRD